MNGIRLRPGRFPGLGAIACALLPVLGCLPWNEDHNLFTPAFRVLEPKILAVTAPDSLALGDSLRVSIHWRGGGCTRFDRLFADASNPRAIRVGLRIIDSNGFCPTNIEHVETVVTLAPPPAGRVRLTVGEAVPIEHVIEVGTPPSSLVRHRIELASPPTPSSPPPHALIYFGEFGVDADTLFFDAEGRAQAARACPDGPSVRTVFVHAAPYSRYLPFESHDLCGHPQVIRLTPP